MWISSDEIFETLRMIELENLDIRTVTLGISISDCADDSMETLCNNIYNKITSTAGKLVEVVNSVSSDFGIPIANRRISLTPIAYVAAPCKADSYIPVAQAMDRAADILGIDYIAGFSSYVQKGMTPADKTLINSIPGALSATNAVCSSVNVASTHSGINMDAVQMMGGVIKETAYRTAERFGIGCAKLVVFCNVPEDNPFVAGALHGFGEAESAVNVGISGPGVVGSVLRHMPGADLGEVSEAIKRTVFKITRMGELVGREVSRRLGVSFGIVDISLAPTPSPGDSVAEILELMGLEQCGAHGTTAALALLTDAVKKGGAMASSHVGGLSGAFIPVSEDAGMVRATASGALSIEKLEAMTSVCSVGLDMVAIPGDTPAETISAIIADEMAIGMINNKTTAARIIPVPGKFAGDRVEYGGLLGSAVVMPVNTRSSEKFVRRAGRIPAPINSLRN